MRMAQVAIADGGSGGDVSYFPKYAGSPRKVNSYKSSAISEKLNEISSINDQIPSLYSAVGEEISALYDNWHTILGYKQINTLSYRLRVTLNQQLNMIKSYCESIHGETNDIINEENPKDLEYWEKAKDDWKNDTKNWVDYEMWDAGAPYYIKIKPETTPYDGDSHKPTWVNPFEFSHQSQKLNYDNRIAKIGELDISEGGILSLIENIKTKVQSIKGQFDSISGAAGVIGVLLTDVNQYTSQIKTIATETNEKLDEIVTTFETNASSLYEMDRRVFNLTSEYGEAYDFNSVSENWDSLSEEDKKALLLYSLLEYHISKGTYENGDSATSGLKLFEVDMDEVKKEVYDWIDSAPLSEFGINLFAKVGTGTGIDLLKSIFEGQEDQPQEATISEGSGGSSGNGGYSGGGYAPSPAPDPEPETPPPADDSGTTNPETPPEDDPGTTDPETPPEDDPGTTDPETPPEDDPGTTDPETPPEDDSGTTEPEPEIGGESEWEAVPDDEGQVQEPEVNTGEDTFTPPEETGDATVTEPNADGTEPLPDANGDVQQPEVGDTGTTEGDVVNPAPDEGEPLPDGNGDVQQPEVGNTEITEGDVVNPAPEEGETLPDGNGEVSQPEVGNTGITEGDVVNPAPDAGTVESGDAAADIASTITDAVTEATTDTGVAELNSNVLENDPSVANMMSSDLTLDNVDPLDVNPVIDDFDFDDLMEGIDDKIGFSKLEIPKPDGSIPLPTDPTITDR